MKKNKKLRKEFDTLMFSLDEKVRLSEITTKDKFENKVWNFIEKAISDSREELIEKVEGMQDRSQSSASLVWNDTLDQVIKVLKSPTADKKE